MWTVLLFWKSIWLFMLDLVVIADCGRYITTSSQIVSYIHDVTEQNHLIFAFKSQSYAHEIHLYNDTMKVGEVNIGPGEGFIMVLTKEGCNETGKYSLSFDEYIMAKQKQFRWMWISWNETALEIGQGIGPGLSLLCSGSFFHQLKYVGFANNGAGSKTYWIIGETNELINESKFKYRKGRRMKVTSKGFQVKGSIHCALLCLGLNGCYGFNLVNEVNGFSKCELIQTDVPYTTCGNHPIMDWDGDIAPAWTHYFL